MKNIIKISSLLMLAVPFLFNCDSNNNDQQILDQANTYLAEAKDSIHSCHDAVQLLGQKFTTPYTLSSGSEFVFDISSKQMVVVKNNQIVKTSKGYTKSDNVYDYFRFVNVYDPNMQCSQYLKRSGIEMETIYITTGFDAGYHKDIKKVIYSNLSNNARKVTVRAYFDYFTVNAPKDEINLIGDTNNIILNKVDTFNMYGTTSYMKARSGNVNFCGDYCTQEEKYETRMFEIPSGYESYVTPKAKNNGSVYSTINCDTIEGTTSFKKLKTLNVAETKDITDHLTDTTIDYFKLTSDILFDSDRTVTLKFNHAVCIDLNGKKLTIKKKASESTPAEGNYSYEGLVVESTKTEDCSLYVIDSQDFLNEHSGIDLIDCSIIVKAPEENANNISSHIAFNSGAVTQTIDFTEEADILNVGPAIVCVGQTESLKAKTQATAQIYGGKVICNNETEQLNHCGCFGAIGKGAIINIDYGDIKSNDYCIFGNNSSGTASLGDATVIISGGKVESTENCCIYFPLKCDIDISGCTLTGTTCLNVNSGNVNIADSTLNASGQYLKYSEKNYDGSVIYSPKHKDDTGDLIINSSGNTMTSSFAYILNITGEELSSNREAHFTSGTYNYYRGNGILTTDTSATITRSGTWTKRAG